MTVRRPFPEERLRAFLLFEAEEAMSTTDTQAELERFRETIEGGRTRRRGTWVAAAVAAAVVAVGGVAVVSNGSDDTPSVPASGTEEREQDDSPGVVVDASGSMVLEGVPDHTTHIRFKPHSTQIEARNALLSGSIRVDLPDRQMVGFAQIRFSSAFTADDETTNIFHQWGEVGATFDSVTCHGPFAWSFYREPHETGGSINLRCDDGSAFAATALVDGDENAAPRPPQSGPAPGPYRLFLTLQDGWYVAG